MKKNEMRGARCLYGIDENMHKIIVANNEWKRLFGCC
jgi:hypothetical protein